MEHRATWGPAWRDGAPPPRRPHRKPALTVRPTPTGYALWDPALERVAGLGPIPLPFTPEATPDEVLAHLRRLNPHRDVLYDEPQGPRSQLGTPSR